MAARRKKRGVPDHAGRMLRGYGGDGIHYQESIQRELDDAGVRVMGERAKKLLAEIAEKSDQMGALKREVSALRRRETECIKAMVERREDRFHDGPAYLFADDAAGTVSVYDADTDELLCVRPIEDEERQESMDLGGGGADEDAE